MRPLAVYIHIPFCLVKCGYCDFNTYAGLEGLKPAYARALEAEVESASGLLRGSEVTSVSFGGGTPGEFPAESLASVISAVRERAGRMTSGAEISIEANPGTSALTDLQTLVEAGLNRVSFGAQSFAEEELRFLDRQHSPGDVWRAVAEARSAGVASVGIDLIFGLPGQTLASWVANLLEGMATGVDHISCYALTVEEGTPLARRVERGEVREAEPDVVAEMYELAEDVLSEAGFVHYEISNWARPGHESRHNTVYWTGGDYLGLGAGAHGFVDGERIENVARPADYIARLSSGGSARAAVAASYRPAAPIALVDWVEARLRLLGGFPAAELKRMFAPELSEVAFAVLRECAAFGIVEFVNDERGQVIRLTARGRLLHMEVCSRLLARLA